MAIGNEAQLKKDMHVISVGGALIAASWIFVAFLPVLSLFAFAAVSEDTQMRLETVLGQWGTFGDMFNCLNVIFSGGAFLGVIYTVILQRREMLQQEAQIAADKLDREADKKEHFDILLLNALSQLAQVQSVQYAANPKDHDETYVKYMMAYNQGHEFEPGETVKGLLIGYKQEMNAIVERLREKAPK